MALPAGSGRVVVILSLSLCLHAFIVLLLLSSHSKNLTHCCQNKTHADTLLDSSRGGCFVDDSRYLAHDVTFLNSNSHDHMIIGYSFAEV